MGYKALRTDRWKYVRYNELEGMDELYDLQADPYEMTNRIDEPDSAAVIQQLGRQIDELLQE